MAGRTLTRVPHERGFNAARRGKLSSDANTISNTRGRPIVELDKLMTEDEQQRVGIGSLTPSQRKALLEWGMRMYSLGSADLGEIENIKYDGRLVILEDGSRWEVCDGDSITSDSWSESDKVIVIDDEMYNLESAEKVSVEKEE